MTLTERDRKIAMIIAPLLVVLAFWFLVFSPQRAESTKLGDQLSQVEGDRDNAVAKAQALQSSKATYASDYETVVRLGKAVPSSLDMPSLLVQLDSAAKGTGIDFDSITAGQRASATSTTPTGSSSSASSATPASGSSSGSGSAPVAAGGDKAQSSPGAAAEKANNASATSDKASQASGAAPTGGTTATTSSTSSPGFDTVPLTFSFEGSYFDLADFFHRVKRFVRVANKDNVQVKGRLMTIDGMSFKSGATFPKITAELTATVYLSPKSQGADAGGTPQGPTTTPAASSSGSSTGSTSTPTPASSTSGGSGGAQ